MMMLVNLCRLIGLLQRCVAIAAMSCRHRFVAAQTDSCRRDLGLGSMQDLGGDVVQFLVGIFATAQTAPSDVAIGADQHRPLCADLALLQPGASDVDVVAAEYPDPHSVERDRVVLAEFRGRLAAGV